MPKKEKEKSWKERQRERQARQQRAQKAQQMQRLREAERKPRKWPKSKMVLGFCLVAMMFTTYGVWQFFEGQKPPAIGGAAGNPLPTGLAPNFSLKDINGSQFSLNQFSGEVIVIHFMAVGCYGQIYPVNAHQLRQLKTICNDYCARNQVTMFTVAVASCENSELARIRTNYGITWIFGNDYDDYNMDIVNAYLSYSILDGAVLLIDKSFEVAEVYTEPIIIEDVATRIDQFLEA